MSTQGLRLTLVGCLSLALVAPLQAQGGKKGKFAPPIVNCSEATENTLELQICAGTTGAPAGFSVQWMSCDDYAAGPDGLVGTGDDNSWFASSDPRLCKASFSGNANGSSWNLAAGQCVDVVIGGLNDADPGVSFNCNEPLACETCYVFRVFAHATSSSNRSDFTANVQCFTAACAPTGFLNGDFCTKSQGFYSSGNAGRDLMIGCFGGDPTGVACTSVAGPILSIGGGTFTYSWSMTGACVDVQPGPGVFLMDSGLNALRTAIGGGGASSYLSADGSNATSMGTGGGLASQTTALTLNVMLSGSACSGFPSVLPGGYGTALLCNWVGGDTFQNDGDPISQATADALNGQSVNDVLAAANAYLGGAGAVAVPYGLNSAAELNELVAALNLAFHDPFDVFSCGAMSSFGQSHLCH